MTDTDPRCAKCGHKRSKHHYRHPFVGPSVQTTIDAQDATIKALVDALGKLCFEVAGLQAFEQGVRHEIGNTNYSAIMTRLNDGGVAIAAAKEIA